VAVTKKKTAERMFAVAIRDGDDLFLWIRLRRSKTGDIYYMFPTGRTGSDWKRWDPHGSLHKDGRFHSKSWGQKTFPQQRQKPDSNFKGTLQMVTRPIASDEPRKFNVRCDPTEFSEIMEVPVGLLSSETYATYIAVDATEPNGQPIITPGGQILAQHAFRDAIPWILVTAFRFPPSPVPVR
jgi:hypothetical protein